MHRNTCINDKQSTNLAGSFNSTSVSQERTYELYLSLNHLMPENNFAFYLPTEIHLFNFFDSLSLAANPTIVALQLMIFFRLAVLIVRTSFYNLSKGSSSG